MSSDLIVGIVMVVFVVLLLLETPVAFALAGAGGLGLIMLGSFKLATDTVTTAAYSTLAHYTLAIFPLYILLGMFAVHGRLAERVYGIAARSLRFLPGGLGVATVAACAGFAAVSGSSVATAASIGRISVGEMRRNGYQAGFATGIVAIGGTLGILIPPSVAMVMYGIISGESIGQLLVAGIVPGVLSALAYMVFVVLVSRRYVSAPAASLTEAVADAAGAHAPARTPAPAGAPAMSGSAAETNREQGTWRGVRAILWLAVIFAAILMGMFSGLFTVIESAAVGAFVALVMLVVENAKDGISGLWKKFSEAAKETGAVSSMGFMLLAGATVFSTFLVMSRAPYRIAEAVGALPVPPILVVVVILLALIPLGMFLESMSILIIVVPLVHPIIMELGFDGVWFAVLFVMMLEVGMVTPPVGMNVFVVSAATRVPLTTAFTGVMPFLIPAFAMVALVILVPELALWLPSMVTGG